ncbi:MAG TPA: AsmA-like C-terminal region-containing protein [Paludibacteraceae bacterium]|nr:AsmA-like C-terminal region-containing protein [Paludibacteraceae bacterium]
MAPNRKRNWIIVVSAIVLVFIILLILPLVFRGKITEIARRELNKQLTAEVNFDKLKVSFIRNFPDASVSLKNIRVTGTGDFAKDTLLFCRDVNLVINLKSLFGNTGYDVKKLEFTDSKVLAHVLKDGRANWDIMKTDTTAALDTSAMSFKFKLKNVIINRADVRYADDEGDIAADVKNLNLRMNGDLTADSTLLVTKLTADTLNFWSEGFQYAHNMTVDIDADINADLNSERYAFANNQMKLNAVPFALNGWVQLIDSGYDMDLTLDASKVDFKSILSLVPAIYAKSFDQLKAEGKVNMSGFIKGKMVGEDYPAFDLNLAVADAWFQYPGLPKSVKDIQLISRLTNPGGSLDKTVIDFPKLSFNLGGNPFAAQGHIATPLTDPDLTMKANGKIDLGMIKEVYPLEKETTLNGILTMDVNMAGKMSYFENNMFERYRFAGTVNVQNMLLKMKDLPQDVAISQALLTFSDRYLNLSNLKMKIGKNDLSADGKAENYMAYALRDKTLKGNFTVKSTYFNLNDFMAAGTDTKNDSSSLTVVKIPKNLDLSLDGSFSQLIYDKMNFRNAAAALKVADGSLNIQKMNVDAFGGVMALTGTYSTSDPGKPFVDFDLDMKEISFKEVFQQVTVMKKIAPIFDKAFGKFNSRLKINSLLQQDMMPVLSSILGNGSLNAKAVAVKEVNALTMLGEALKSNELANLTLKDLALMFEIKDGKVNTKPFTIKAANMEMKLGGSTGLDQSIDYAGNIRLPEKMNLGKFSNVGFKILGTFTKPKIQLDLKNTLTTLAEEKKAVVMQKADSLKNVAIDKGRAEREKALKQAQAKADQILEKAKLAGDKLIVQAQAQGDSLVAKASNPVMKQLARKGADQLMKEARKQAENLNKKAKDEADKVMQQANEATGF